MTPRAGGEADKFGGRFEFRRTMRWMLDVLAGRARSIVIEERGEGGEGIEFTVVGNDGQADSHQVKRQRGNRNGWSLRELGVRECWTQPLRKSGEAGGSGLSRWCRLASSTSSPTRPAVDDRAVEIVEAGPPSR